ncbi:hypothetical protein PIB30_071944 [Stylosanthes scabra]|uniref:Uncharacterized protein n=1 Tax=Stylosanthes scabra TaxID=79078 RepID=A0ABU6SP18_9FABA|nr:hypothetical protein [Stylosanthes scabra]
MKIRQEQFFENMQKAQSQYPEELKSLKTKQDEMVNQQNNFYRQIKREQEKTIKEIEEVKKFQVNQTLMGAHRTPVEKLEERFHETRNEEANQRLDMECLIKRRILLLGTSTSKPNLVEIPPHKIPDFLHNNVAKKKRILTMELSSQISNKENPLKLLTNLFQILLILRIKVV